MSKKKIFSGVQPSGDLHIGNYLGAIKQWVEMQNEYDCIFCVVDYHAITVKQDPEILRKKILEIAKIYIAAGIDPKKSVIFQQSDVSAHTELAWVLNCITKNSDLTKMTQFKSKSGIQIDFEGLENVISNLIKSEMPNKIKPLLTEMVEKGYNKEEHLEIVIDKLKDAMLVPIFTCYKDLIHKFNKVGIGLFDYPVLMAADILLYNTDVVPVGDDQVQHVELTRELAKRFNTRFGETFKIPEVKIKKEGARIMGLDNPEKKMSKSAASSANYIALLDDPQAAAKKIMRAVTDSGSEIKYDKENKPAIANLLTIYSLLAGTPIKDLEKKYSGKGYGDFKKDLAEVVRRFLTDFQKRYKMISDSEAREILSAGAQKIAPIAEKILGEVKKKIGAK